MTHPLQLQVQEAHVKPGLVLQAQSDWEAREVLDAILGADSRRSASFALQWGHFISELGTVLEATSSSNTLPHFRQR